MSPKLLVSVRDTEEALSALAGGADWIDLKEPNAGPLAAVEASVAKEAVQALASRRTISAALGELLDWDHSAAKKLLAVEGISVVKLGLSGCAQRNHWQQEWQAIADAAIKSDKQLAAVIYADWQLANAPAPEDVISVARSVGSHYLLIDTYEKGAGSVFDHLSASKLGQLLQLAQQASLVTVLAGSITAESIDQIPSQSVDIVAVRGAICDGARTAKVETALVAKFHQALSARYAVTRVLPGKVS